MSESTLALAYSELIAEIGYALGYGRTSGSWDAGQSAHVESVLLQGLQQFYYPPALLGERLPHTWAFLRPIVTLTTASSTYNYELPDDFAGMEGDMTFEPSEGFAPVKLVGEARIREMRQNLGATVTGRPQYVAVRPKTSDGTDGQRFEAIFYPTPDGAYVLSYQTNALFSKLTSTNPYPLGGAVHARTLLNSCLAVIEEKVDRVQQGPAWKAWMDSLTASVQHDRRQSPANLGYNGDRSDGRPGVQYFRTNLVTNGGRYS